MRVVDDFLKSVGFVAEVISLDSGREDLDHVATGFFVSLPIAELPGKSLHHFVTAKHVLEGLAGRSCCFLVNKKQGGVAVIRQPIGSIWWTHPTDVHADVAVTLVAMDSSYDIVSIGTDLFLTPELMAERHIGIGDEVFMVGLFSYAPGRSRNMPIVRYGTIAMLPEDDIYVGSGFTKANLIEARSIGGISGSPVFARETVYLGLDGGVFMHGVGRHYLLGLMHGHWDISESEMNRPNFSSGSARGVNMGIGVVVPAVKILETLNSPSLLAIRQRFIASLRPAADQ